MGYWIVKTEPSAYSYADLEREGTTSWDGVKNPVAMKHLRAMQAGDEGAVYSTGDDKLGVGLSEDISPAAHMGGAELQGGRPIGRVRPPVASKGVEIFRPFGIV